MSSPVYSLSPAPYDHLSAVYRSYAALAGTLPFDPERGLGGRVVYAGRIETENRLQTAASVAGAASLGASPETAALRQAMRDGAVDFVVTSLEEALRIVKNEVRKRNPIAVAVSETPERLVCQMLERGVVPDLLPPLSWDSNRTGMDEAAERRFADWGSLRLVEPDGTAGKFVTWRLDRKSAIWLPRLDGVAMSVVPEADQLRRRWLSLSPRYLGREAMQHRGLALQAEELVRFKSEASALVLEREAAGEEPVAVEFETVA